MPNLTSLRLIDGVTPGVLAAVQEGRDHRPYPISPVLREEVEEEEDERFEREDEEEEEENEEEEDDGEEDVPSRGNAVAMYSEVLDREAAVSEGRREAGREEEEQRSLNRTREETSDLTSGREERSEEGQRHREGRRRSQGRRRRRRRQQEAAEEEEEEEEEEEDSQGEVEDNDEDERERSVTADVGTASPINEEERTPEREERLQHRSNTTSSQLYNARRLFTARRSRLRSQHCFSPLVSPAGLSFLRPLLGQLEVLCLSRSFGLSFTEATDVNLLQYFGVLSPNIQELQLNGFTKMSDGFVHEILVACGGPNIFSSPSASSSSCSSSLSSSSSPPPGSGRRRAESAEERDRETNTRRDRTDRRRRSRRREEEEEEEEDTTPPPTATVAHRRSHFGSCVDSLGPREDLETNRREDQTALATTATTDTSSARLPCSSFSSSSASSSGGGCTYTTRACIASRRPENGQSPRFSKKERRREGERLLKARGREEEQEEELKLRRVSFEASDISDLGLSALAMTMGARAEYVCLKRCLSLSEVGHAALAEHCPNLTSLNLGYCSAVNDMSLTSILNACRSLRTLVLNEARITDVGLELIGECLGENLLELALHRSEEITNEGVSFLAKSCKNLSLLSLSSCSQVTDAGVCKVAEFCSKLLKLRLDGTRVTDVSIRRVAKSLGRLRYLHLQRCSRVSGDILQYFSVRTHPCLKCIEISRRSPSQITSQHIQLFRKQNRPSTALLLLDSTDGS